MSAPAHSPAPFRHIAATGQHGHLILDAFGDSIGGLARETGDHPREEQLANARLFTASPGLLASLKTCLREIDFEIEHRLPGENRDALQQISDEGHRAVRAAEDPGHV